MTPDQEQLAFFRELGGAIQQWQYVELTLYQVAKACSDQDPGHIYDHFYNLRSFESRVQYADSVISPKLKDTQLRDDWCSLHSRIRDDGQERNKIAHYLVLITPGKKPGRRYGLWPPRARVPKTGDIRPEVLPPSGVLGVKDLWLRARRFSESAGLLMNFVLRLQGQEERFSPNPGTPPRAPTLAQLVKEIQDLAGGGSRIRSV